MSEDKPEIQEEDLTGLSNEELSRRLNYYGKKSAKEFAYELRGEAERMYERLNRESEIRDAANVKAGNIPGMPGMKQKPDLTKR